MRGYHFWACLADLALTAGGRADDTYTIKLKHAPDVGKSTVVTDTSSQASTSNVFDADGKPLAKDDKHVQKQEEKYTETVLEKGDKRPAKYKRVYEKAT